MVYGYWYHSENVVKLDQVHSKFSGASSNRVLQSFINESDILYLVAIYITVRRYRSRPHLKALSSKRILSEFSALKLLIRVWFRCICIPSASWSLDLDTDALMFLL